MLYLAVYTNTFSNKLDFNLVEKEFIKKYPLYKPSKGIRDFLIMNWEKYVNGDKSEK